MQPRGLRKTDVAIYRIVSHDGPNYSGIKPIGERILVLPDQATDKTHGGAFLDPTTVENFTDAAETGVLVAAGPDAFLWNSDRTRRWEGEKPKIGDRVCFERYAGQKHHSWDGQVYRVMDDKCLGALEEPVPEEVIQAYIAKRQAEGGDVEVKTIGQLMTETLGLDKRDDSVALPIPPTPAKPFEPANVVIPRGQSERIGRVVELLQAKEDYLCRIAVENPTQNLARIVDKVLETLPAEPREIVEAVTRRKLGIKD